MAATVSSVANRAGGRRSRRGPVRYDGQGAEKATSRTNAGRAVCQGRFSRGQVNCNFLPVLRYPPVNVNATDNALMAAVGQGEVQKLAVLFERHHRGLFRYFVSMNRHRELSEDLVQDVFFRMLRYRASYDAQQSFTAWMYQIARNASVDQAQKRRGEVIGIDEFTEHKADPSAGPEESAVRSQDLQLLRLALDRLP